jgi:hypothetical protein
VPMPRVGAHVLRHNTESSITLRWRARLQNPGAGECWTPVWDSNYLVIDRLVRLVRRRVL